MDLPTGNGNNDNPHEPYPYDACMVVDDYDKVDTKDAENDDDKIVFMGNNSYGVLADDPIGEIKDEKSDVGGNDD